jgi:hypothetical protein
MKWKTLSAVVQVLIPLVLLVVLPILCLIVLIDIAHGMLHALRTKLSWMDARPRPRAPLRSRRKV